MKRMLIVAIALAAVFALCARANAATLYVANNGADGIGCGGSANPCRSFGQTIANANGGDTILAGPGVYGDINGNGTLGEAGEEAMQPGCSSLCMIYIDKSITVLSERGETSTMIRMGAAVGDVVRIGASGVRFGRRSRAFLS